MRQDISQNINLPQANPLLPASLKKNFRLKIPQNPKIVILIVLVIIILLLLTASLFTHRTPSPPPQTKNASITTNPSSSTTIPTSANPVPSQFADQLNQIETLLQPTPIIDPPRIDANIKVIY